MTPSEHKRYVLKHGILLPNKQVFLTKPLFVYKKICTYLPREDNVIDNKFNNLDPGHSGVFPYFAQATSNSVLKKAANRYVTESVHGDEDAIANLIIVPGSIVNLAQDKECKMRANTAVVHSITRISDKMPVAFGTSSYESSFLYASAIYFEPPGMVDSKSLRWSKYNSIYENTQRPGWMNKYSIFPTYQFSTDPWDCSSGIHFFLEADRALKY